ncbi:DUF4136 domain-containing protein [Sphingobium sp. H39-3-25]|uniref:DUF4136 domain-containing protein n=1 Tax=Sphingobium arseniciresistens TaxID=3030834 RepID=UPI0023B93B55|nr:DUF4136 domain-containing protein [Sphingobium arseniciresistens]
MSKFRALGLVAASAAALLALSGCATNFKADVARFQRMPAPTGQSFAVVADDPRLAGGLEFSHYAGLVGAQLAKFGYQPSSDPAKADLVVRIAYDVDNGREKVRSTGFGDPWGAGWGGGWGWGPRRYYGGRFAYGFYDPFLFGGPGFGGYNDVSSYTVYTSDLEMKIDRAADGVRLFEGKAQAQSLSNKLTYLVPNLVEAIFVDFPGQSGENVKITLAPEPKAAAQR